MSASDEDNELMQMVRVCREFDKYTGTDEIIVYNIDSKYAPKFHIHPNLLASNFFERRQQFYDELKEVVQNIEDDDELFEYCEDEEVSFMLHHFGIQTIIQKINRYKEKLEIKQLKAQQKETNQRKNNKNKSDTNPSDLRKQQKKIRTTIKQKKSFFEKIKKKPLLWILWLLASLHNGEKVTVHTSSFLYRKACLMLDLGYAADMYKVKIFKMIKDSSSSQLHKKFKFIKLMDKNTNFSHVDKKQMILMCNDLRSWTMNGIKGISSVAYDYKHKAIKLLAKHFFSYYDCKLCHYPHIHNIKNNENLGSELLGGECVSSRDISNKHHYAKAIGVIKICIANDLIVRVEELNTLGLACGACKEYFIALKMFRCSYKLSQGYIIDEQTPEEEVLKCILDLRQTWWDMKCNFCGIRASKSKGYEKHKACIGCMKVVYCSRECQKIDWNTKHRIECDKSWKSIYGALRMSILDRL
eukprot:207312_1